MDPVAPVVLVDKFAPAACSVRGRAPSAHRIRESGCLLLECLLVMLGVARLLSSQVRLSELSRAGELVRWDVQSVRRIECCM